ncbi:hypothetical protein ACP_0372 [Acidobacterium capsulatum ATCC 51196]|uniref:Uncharacterized protein n=1 Tax=Acidobacterium capsulatum (strain ATCC 51196 / DSM 11244 / BCRC 80197 / JCM 7670 / NBRC 15755 / NCIMB 13165 / 161) TaxID=240015 RepID=C1F9Z5_ACIC5|nr:hypothetical protein ACP_0372 [Acidobacterium capsulatum ATCC 51196]
MVGTQPRWVEQAQEIARLGKAAAVGAILRLDERADLLGDGEKASLHRVLRFRSAASR